MCGRFTLRTPAAAVAKYFDLLNVPDFQANYNVAPTTQVLVIRETGASLMTWGLVPHWAKEPKAGQINARSESAAEKPMFREAVRKRRCLMVADGFFEWTKIDGKKQPFYFHMKDGHPFAFAGMWEQWGDLETCALLTTTPNDVVAKVHDRMPVILSPADYPKWMDSTLQDAAAVKYMLDPYPGEEMVGYAVNPEVNSVRNNDPDCIAPIPMPAAD